MSSVFVGISLVLFAYAQPDTELVIQHYRNIHTGSLSYVSQLALRLHTPASYSTYSVCTVPLYIRARVQEQRLTGTGLISTMKFSPTSTDCLILTVPIRAPSVLFG